ncbi:hypothetical protein ACJX0J_012295, partial [Zea mays]
LKNNFLNHAFSLATIIFFIVFFFVFGDKMDKRESCNEMTLLTGGHVCRRYNTENKDKHTIRDITQSTMKKEIRGAGRGQIHSLFFSNKINQKLFPWQRCMQLPFDIVTVYFLNNNSTLFLSSDCFDELIHGCVVADWMQIRM